MLPILSVDDWIFWSLISFIFREVLSVHANFLELNFELKRWLVTSRSFQSGKTYWSAVGERKCSWVLHVTLSDIIVCRRVSFAVGVGTVYNRTHNNWVTRSTKYEVLQVFFPFFPPQDLKLKTALKLQGRTDLILIEPNAVTSERDTPSCDVRNVFQPLLAPSFSRPFIFAL